MGDLYTRAVAFATEAHAGQTRKIGPDGETEPYVEHCKRVAEMVWALTQSEELAAAAALHDVLEDTDVGLEAVAEEFGFTVTSWVVQLTDEYTPEAWPQWNREKRKAKEAKKHGEHEWPTRLVKLCDCIDNARSIEAVGGGFVQVWRAELAELLPLLMREASDG